VLAMKYFSSRYVFFGLCVFSTVFLYSASLWFVAPVFADITDVDILDDICASSLDTILATNKDAYITWCTKNTRLVTKVRSLVWWLTSGQKSILFDRMYNRTQKILASDVSQNKKDLYTLVTLVLYTPPVVDLSNQMSVTCEDSLRLDIQKIENMSLGWQILWNSVWVPIWAFTISFLGDVVVKRLVFERIWGWDETLESVALRNLTTKERLGDVRSDDRNDVSFAIDHIWVVWESLPIEMIAHVGPAYRDDDETEDLAAWDTFFFVLKTIELDCWNIEIQKDIGIRSTVSTKNAGTVSIKPDQKLRDTNAWATQVLIASYELTFDDPTLKQWYLESITFTNEWSIDLDEATTNITAYVDNQKTSDTVDAYDQNSVSLNFDRFVLEEWVSYSLGVYADMVRGVEETLRLDITDTLDFVVSTRGWEYASNSVALMNISESDEEKDDRTITLKPWRIWIRK